MKKLFIILFAAVSFIFTACDDNLDTTPSDQISEDLPFKTLEGAQTVLTGTYNCLSDGVYNHYLYQNIWFIPDVMGDDVFVSESGNYGRFVPTYQYNLTPQSSYSYDPWAAAYKMIDNANLILDNIKTLAESAERNRIEGEASALRAYGYHYLVRLYAKPYNYAPDSPGVVLRTTSSYEPLPRATVKEVYAQMETDLLNAVSLLTVSTDAKKLYIDQRAAKALLARVYLDMPEKRTEAIKYAEEALSGLTLMDKSVYATETFSDYNSETIWAFESSADDNGFYLSIGAFYYYADGGKYVDGKLEYKNVVDGYSSFRVTRNLVNLFDDADIRKKNFPLIDGTNEYLYRTGGSLITSKIRHRGYAMGQGAINFLRGSEMDLIIAEAAADGQDYTKARAALNAVRVARGLSEYSGSNTNLADEIQTERRRELFAEGHRIFDIKRRGLPLTRKVDGKLMTGQWSDVEIPANGDRFECPIPQKEIDANKALSNADQNAYYK